MDRDLSTVNPANMSLNAYNHQNFSPSTEFGAAAVSFHPQFPTWNQQSTNFCRVEYQSVKKPRTSLPLRTELCLQFRRGHCSYGDTCHFAHVIRDTQKLLPHRQGLMAKDSNVVRNWNEDHRIITTMKLCRRFCSGQECPYGERCNFLHEDPAKFRKSFSVRTGSTGPGGSSRNGCDQVERKTSVHSGLIGNSLSPKPIFWKTRLCNKWEATGNCPFGVNCHFAHGNAELRKFGSHNAMESGNFSSSLVNPTAPRQESLCRVGNRTAFEQPLKSKKCLIRWKRFEKINDIYADWIDDIHLVHVSLTKVES